MATINEIKNLIKTKIEGQGSQVDIGNGLPQILNGIVDALEAIPEVTPSYIDLAYVDDTPLSNLSKSEMCEALEITDKQFDDLLAGKYSTARWAERTFGINIVAEDTVAFIVGELTEQSVTVYASLKHSGNKWTMANY